MARILSLLRPLLFHYCVLLPPPPLPPPLSQVVMPVPDTARTCALQVATHLGIPYREGFIKNRYIARTFIMPGQGSRVNAVRRKLNPIKSEFAGKIGSNEPGRGSSMGCSNAHGTGNGFSTIRICYDAIHKECTNCLSIH